MLSSSRFAITTASLVAFCAFFCAAVPIAGAAEMTLANGSCGNPAKRELICRVNTQFDSASSDKSETLKLIESESKKLKSCISALVGKNRTINRRKRDDAGLVLDSATLKVVLASTYAKTRETIDINHNPQLAAAVSGLALSEASFTADWLENENPTRALELTSTAVNSCLLATEAISLLPPVEIPGREHERFVQTLALRESLGCSLRYKKGLWRYPMLRRWPGCRCNPDAKGQMRGTMMNGVCITRPNANDPFADYPIDERMPEAMSRFVKNLRAKTAPLKLVQVGLAGCDAMRFMRGGVLDYLRAGSELSVRHVSEHSHGVACDLSSLVFKDLWGKTIEFKMSSKNTYPFAAVLDKYARAANVTSFAPTATGKGNSSKFPTRRKLEDFYRRVESDVARSEFPPQALDMSNEEWTQLRLGVFMRNALVDAGLRVLDPTFNDAHKDHFHAELPNFDSILKDVPKL